MPDRLLALMAAGTHRTLVLGVGVALGVLVVLLAIPLILKRVRPNRYYGLVTVNRFESQSLWYRANRFLGVALLVAGLVTIAGNVLIWVLPRRTVTSSNKVLVGVEAALVVVPAVVAYVAAAIRYRRG